MTSPVYFSAPDGTVYRVLDTAWRDGRHTAADPPAAWATTRVFRAESGERRFYPLAFLELYPDETREPRPEWLARQFARSEASGPRRPAALAQRAASPVEKQR
jgi:hypothetical protein